MVSPTHTPYLFACLHELLSCVYAFCSYIHRRPVPMTTLVLQTRKVDNDMCVNIFKLTRDMTPIKINNQQKKSSVCFVLLFVCLCICVCECLPHNNHQTNHKNNSTCGSAYEPGGSGLPCYCAPPACVPAVLGALAVWQFSTKKIKKRERTSLKRTTPRVFFHT